MSDLATYLAGLKAGDVVTTQYDTYSSRRLEDITIDRTTSKQIVSGDERFWRRSGAGIGRSYKCRIILPNDAARQRAHPNLAGIIDRTHRTLRGDITLTTIPAMRAALDEAEAVLREAGE